MKIHPRKSSSSKVNLLKVIILFCIILITYFSCSSQPTITLICGDVDHSGVVDTSDMSYIIYYTFAGTEAPDPLIIGDTDCSGSIDISDAVYIYAYLFGGPEPCAGCPIDENTSLIGRPLIFHTFY